MYSSMSSIQEKTGDDPPRRLLTYDENVKPSLTEVPVAWAA